MSAARDICSLATTQPAFVNILHLGNIFALPQQTAVLFTSNRGASCAGTRPQALLCYRHLLTSCWMQKRNVLFALPVFSHVRECVLIPPGNLVSGTLPLQAPSCTRHGGRLDKVLNTQVASLSRIFVLVNVQHREVSRL